MSKAVYVHPEEAAGWEELAQCRGVEDQELFFPEHANRSPAQAKRICNRCPVRRQCLEVALRNDEAFGIWGGLTERERRDLKRRYGRR